MDKMSKIELTSTITKQNEQLKRYESRLRDVVTAYKGVVREKEALEASLAAVNKTSDGASSSEGDSVAALTLSVSTLVAEKARIEEAYQNDKKVAREQNDRIVKELQDQLNSLAKQKQLEIDNFRAKLAYEIQEREREQVEHSLMLKELQMKLTSERRSKEKLEDRISITSENSGNLDLEKKLRDLNNELEATQRKLNRSEARTLETPQMLIQMQEEITQMKQNHVLAIREERIKAKRLEEGAKRMCASQEERIATLEARLAELSETVGEYDRQRRRDQDVIQKLKNSSTGFQDGKVETVRSLEREKRRSFVDNTYQDENSNAERPTGMAYLQELIDKIHNLKKDLIIGNEAMGNPIDIWNIFNISGSGVQNIHSACKAELAALKTEYELFKRQHSQNTDSSVQQKKMNKTQVEKLKSHINSLQEKAEILNQQLEDTEKECEARVGDLEEKIKTMSIAHKEEQSEYKNRITSLEQQLQAQRERYSVLLGEREGEIKARHEKESEGKIEVTRFMNGAMQEVPATPMLHYAHELARKDLEISQLRKDKHQLEGQLRDCQRDATIEKDRFKEVRRNLKEEIDRLLRIQSREGANLEYLKNVVLSYLLSTDLFRKKHMLKAIAAVLHFTDAEKENAYKAVL